MGENVKANEQGFIAKKEGWSIDILSPSSSGLGGFIENGIEHHYRQILSSCLAHGLATGSNGKGSYNLSQTQDKDLNEYARQKAQYLVNQINKYVCQRLIDINFGKQEYYPELNFEMDDNVSKKETAETIKAMVDMKVLDPLDPETNNYIRKSLDAPALSDEQYEELLIKKELYEANQFEQAKEPINEKVGNGEEQEAI